MHLPITVPTTGLGKMLAHLNSTRHGNWTGSGGFSSSLCGHLHGAAVAFSQYDASFLGAIIPKDRKWRMPVSYGLGLEIDTGSLPSHSIGPGWSKSSWPN